MTKSFLKNVIILSLSVILIGLIYAVISNSYYDCRIYLYDLNKDGIFEKNEETLPGFDYYSEIFYGRQFFLGVIMMIPFIFVAVTVFLCITDFLYRKNYLFAHKIVTLLESPVSKVKFIFQLILCVTIEIFVVVIFLLIYKTQPELFYDQYSFINISLKNIYVYSVIYFALTLGAILLFKTITKYEVLLRLIWLYFLYLQIESLICQSNNISKENLIFLLLPISSLIPCVFLSLRKIDSTLLVYKL